MWVGGGGGSFIRENELIVVDALQSYENDSVVVTNSTENSEIYEEIVACNPPRQVKISMISNPQKAHTTLCGLISDRKHI